jgi:hypothetical protein
MYEFYINVDGKLLLWENLTLQEAELLDELTVKLNPSGWKSSGWTKIISERTNRRMNELD